MKPITHKIVRTERTRAMEIKANKLEWSEMLHGGSEKGSFRFSHKKFMLFYITKYDDTNWKLQLSSMGKSIFYNAIIQDRYISEQAAKEHAQNLFNEFVLSFIQQD